MGITVIVITHEMAVIEAICDVGWQSLTTAISRRLERCLRYSGPKSNIGRQLILGEVGVGTSFGQSRQIRIIFDGRESSEPVIANMVLACKVPVNIMHADMKILKEKPWAR